VHLGMTLNNFPAGFTPQPPIIDQEPLPHQKKNRHQPWGLHIDTKEWLQTNTRFALTLWSREPAAGMTAEQLLILLSFSSKHKSAEITNHRYSCAVFISTHRKDCKTNTHFAFAPVEPWNWTARNEYKGRSLCIPSLERKQPQGRGGI